MSGLHYKLFLLCSENLIERLRTKNKEQRNTEKNKEFRSCHIRKKTQRIVCFIFNVFQMSNIFDGNFLTAAPNRWNELFSICYISSYHIIQLLKVYIFKLCTGTSQTKHLVLSLEWALQKKKIICSSGIIVIIKRRSL